MPDGSVKSHLPVDSIHHTSTPPAGCPNTAWTIFLMTLGGLIFFVTSRIWKRISNTLRKRRRMTNSPTKQRTSQTPPVSATTKKVSKQFRDAGLDAVMEKCKTIKTKLRKVEDPEIARKAKIAQLLSSSKPRGPLMISPDKLQVELQSLRAIELTTTRKEDGSEGKKPLAKSPFLQDMRRKLKPVASRTNGITVDAENRSPDTPTSSSTGEESVADDFSIV